MIPETEIMRSHSLQKCVDKANATGKKIIGPPAVNREWITIYGTTKMRPVFYLPVMG